MSSWTVYLSSHFVDEWIIRCSTYEPGWRDPTLIGINLSRHSGALPTDAAHHFVMMSEEKHGAILFHCTAGKDRTGLIAALLLGLARVDAVTIAEDCALTEQYLVDLKQELYAKAAAAGQDMTTYTWMLESKPEAILNTLAYLEEQYESVPAYLRRIGLSQRQLDHLYQRLIGA